MTFEEYMTRVRTHLEDGWDAYWLMGDLLFAAKEIYEGDEKFDKAAASELGCSANWIHALIKTAKMFPPDERAKDASWEIHRICAATREPHKWLTEALRGALSTAQLRDAIAAAKDPGPAKDEAQAEADRIIRKVKAFAEKWRGGGFGDVQRIMDAARDLLIGYPSPLIEGAEAKTYA